MFSILASIAEFESELWKERQLEGNAKATENGVQFGRKSKLTDEQIEEMRDKRKSGVLIRELMSEYKLSKLALVSVI